MEVLSDVLRAMRVRGSVYFCDRLEAPWRMDIAHPTTAGFHLVRRGECWVSSREVEARLGPGDLVYIEAGRDHVLASHPPGAEPAAPGAETLLLCAYCEIEGGATQSRLSIGDTRLGGNGAPGHCTVSWAASWPLESLLLTLASGFVITTPM